jgi:hypothetical protein
MSGVMTAVLIVAAVSLLVVSGCAWSKPQPQGLVINGVVDVPSSPPSSGADCRVAARLADVTAGAQVVVTDASDTQVGQGTLNPAQDWSPCNLRYDFRITGVPAGRGPYGLEVAGHGRVLFSEDALRQTVVHLPAS